MHDENKVLMGTTRSSYKVVDNYPGTVLPAGTVAHLATTGSPMAAKSAGAVLGVSLGRSLSDTARTAVCRKGVKVPLLLTAAYNPNIGDIVSIDDTTGLGKAPGAGVTDYYHAVYSSERLTVGGEAEDGSTVGVALIDFAGGF